MVRVCSKLLLVVVACLVVVSVALAQDQQPKKKRGGGTPEERKAAAEKRFDDMEKAVKHDPLKGELTKDEFMQAAKELPGRGKMATNPEEFFKNIKKADENKVLKAEFVTAVTERTGGGKKKQAE